MQLKPLQKKRRLDNVFRVNKRDAQGGSQFRGVRKREKVESAFAVELTTFDSIYVRENPVDGILREVVEGSALWNNRPEQGVIILHMGLLVRRIGVTEEDERLLLSVGGVFKIEDIAELAAVVGEQNRKEITKGKAEAVQLFFERLNFPASLRCRFIIQQQAEHKIDVDELEGHDDLAADGANDGVHFYRADIRMILHVSQEIRIRPTNTDALGHISYPGFRSGLELYSPWKVDL